MLKWFSLSGIAKEVKRIRWPKTADTANNSSEVLLFCVFFGVFFVVAELVVTFFLQLIGVVA